MTPSFHIDLTDSDFADIRLETETLAQVNAVIQRHSCKSPDDVIASCQDADALMVQWTRISRSVMENLPNLKAIARFGIGVDMIDVAAAKELGVAVCNTPDYCIEEVATHALSLILTFARQLPALQAATRQKLWGIKSIDRPIRSLSSQTLGLVGIGRIGHNVARFASALGMRVIAYDPFIESNTIPIVGFDHLLAEADFISLHAPLNDATRDLFSEQTFDRMKSSAYLINTSRGGLVNSAALNDALRSGKIAGAGLDVLPSEPPDWDDPLLTAPNLVLTPHVAWYALGAPERMRREAASSLVQLFQGSAPSGLLNPDALQSARWTKER